MKNQSFKTTFKISFMFLAVFCIFLRIFYINAIKYPAPLPQTYMLNEIADYRNFDIYVSEYAVYTDNQLKEMFTIENLEFADETEIVLNMHIKNNSNDKRRLELSTFTLEYDYLSGGGVNPVLFSFFNSNLSTLDFEPNEEKNIMLPYPLIDEHPHLLLSLYPQKIIIEIE